MLLDLINDSRTSEANVQTITDNTGTVITIRVHRVDRSIDYHRSNRGKAEVFDRPDAELHDLFSTLSDFVTVSKKKKILDIGCGDGALVRDLRAARLNATGLDLYLTPETKHKTEYVEGDAFRIPFASQTFDTAISIWSVFKYEPYDRMRPLLSEALRVIKPNGSLLLSSMIDPVKVKLLSLLSQQMGAKLFQTQPNQAIHIIKY